MKCKYCQAEMPEEEKICPACGKAQQEQSGTETVQAPEAPEIATAPEHAQPQKKAEGKAAPGKIALAIAAAVVLLAVFAALIINSVRDDRNVTDIGNQTEPSTSATAAPETEPEDTTPATVPADGNPEDETCKGSYTVTDEEAVAAADTIVATLGDKTLTNKQLQVYYWAEVGTYYSQYGESAIYFGLDFSQPLDTQMCPLDEDEPMTWQQFFLRSALDNWHCYQSLLSEADAEGYAPEQEFLDYLEQLPQNFESAAVANGAASSEDYVKTVAGAGCTVEDYLEYVEVYNKTYLYYSDTCAKIVPTAAEVEAFFAENQEEYEAEGITKTGGKYVDVRHILLMPDDENATTDEIGYPVYSDEAWKTCEAEAQQIYNQWLAGDRSEESFSQYAMEHSEDGNASTGGLYENVYLGQMVENFENWCFDEARQPGDHGLVKTPFGYHIMYYVGDSDIWYITAESDLIENKSAEIIPAAMEKYALNVDYSQIALGYVEMNY